MNLSHIDTHGKASMVDISEKPVVRRIAVASGKIVLKPETIQLIRENLIKKGDVLATAKIAGILAAKKTPELIPLCHGLNIEHADITFEIDANSIIITGIVKACDKTGVEMEALTAVSVAALTIYDMCKAVDKEMKIEEIYLLEKRKEVQ